MGNRFRRRLASALHRLANRLSSDPRWLPAPRSMADECEQMRKEIEAEALANVDVSPFANQELRNLAWAAHLDAMDTADRAPVYLIAGRLRTLR